MKLSAHCVLLQWLEQTKTPVIGFRAPPKPWMSHSKVHLHLCMAPFSPKKYQGLGLGHSSWGATVQPLPLVRTFDLQHHGVGRLTFQAVAKALQREVVCPRPLPRPVTLRRRCVPSAECTCRRSRLGRAPHSISRPRAVWVSVLLMGDRVALVSGLPGHVPPSSHASLQRSRLDAHPTVPGTRGVRPSAVLSSPPVLPAHSSLRVSGFRVRS